MSFEYLPRLRRLLEAQPSLVRAFGVDPEAVAQAMVRYADDASIPADEAIVRLLTHWPSVLLTQPLSLESVSSGMLVWDPDGGARRPVSPRYLSFLPVGRKVIRPSTKLVPRAIRKVRKQLPKDTWALSSGRFMFEDRPTADATVRQYRLVDFHSSLVSPSSGVVMGVSGVDQEYVETAVVGWMAFLCAEHNETVN